MPADTHVFLPGAKDKQHELCAALVDGVPCRWREQAAVHGIDPAPAELPAVAATVDTGPVCPHCVNPRTTHAGRVGGAKCLMDGLEYWRALAEKYAARLAERGGKP